MGFGLRSRAIIHMAVISWAFQFYNHLCRFDFNGDGDDDFDEVEDDNDDYGDDSDCG